MKSSFKSALVYCCSVMFLVSAENAIAVNALQSEYSNVLAACNAEARSLKGASRDSFVLKCRIEKTSLEEKTKSCEHQMVDSVSKKVQRDPVLREQFISSCVQRWNPKIR